MSKLINKAAVVTGAASGIGLSTVEAFLREGAKVLMTDIDEKAGRAAALRLQNEGLPASFQVHDVTNEAQWRAALDTCETMFGQVDVLVNNAGIGAFCDIENLSLAQWRKTIATNLDSVFLGTRDAIGRMKTKGGLIVNVASIEGIIGDPLIPAYNASKAGVRIFTRSAAAHCARQGYPIRINAICPGFVMTPMVKGALDALDSKQAQQIATYLENRIPMGRLGHADEIARCMVFLACDDSSYMTGSDLVIDGGYLSQ